MTHEQAEALNAIAKEVHTNAKNKGFHEGEENGITIERMAMFTSNLHGEVSELWEAARRNQLFRECDKGIPLSNAAEELADIVIRAMDTAVSLGVDIGRAVSVKARYNESRAHMHGKLA